MACDPITSRPPAVFRTLSVVFATAFFGLISLAAGAAFLSPPPGQPRDPSGLFFMVMGFGMIALGTGGAIWERRAAIIADQEGLRWRGLGRWMSARWDEVSDYFDKLPPRGASVVFSVIQTQRGAIRFSNKWSNQDVLRAAVGEQATQTRANGWETLGCRASDPWPRVFDYDTFNNRWTPTFTLKLFLAFVAYLLVKPALGLAALGGLVGWRMALITAGLYALLIVPMGLLFLLPLAQWREVKRRKGQTITVDLNGVVFQEGERSVAAAWPDVTGYFVERDGFNPLYVVETRQGNFDFLAAVGQAGLLQAIIRQWATEAKNREWEPREDPNTLGGEAALWSGGRVGVGARRYHYQTTYFRSMLWVTFVFGLTALLLAGVMSQGLTGGGDWRVCLASAVACLAVWAICWRTFRACAVLVDDEGVTQITLLDRRTLAWSQVRDYFLWKPWYTEEASVGVVLGRDGRITFRAGIVSREELKAEIQRCATECGGKQWEVRKRP